MINRKQYDYILNFNWNKFIKLNSIILYSCVYEIDWNFCQLVIKLKYNSTENKIKQKNNEPKSNRTIELSQSDLINYHTFTIALNYSPCYLVFHWDKLI